MALAGSDGELRGPVCKSGKRGEFCGANQRVQEEKRDQVSLNGGFQPQTSGPHLHAAQVVWYFSQQRVKTQIHSAPQSVQTCFWLQGISSSVCFTMVAILT
jgi:hypothetical protein